MHVVEGALKEYDWGVVDGLARWHGRATGGPQAELWFGSHPAGPAVVVEGPDRGRPLSEIPGYAGMPMVKLLAASTPLSLQVHPDSARAEAGWRAQQAAPQGERLYSDAAEKSEMLCAIDSFDAHAGWRDPAAAADVLARAGAPGEVVAAVSQGDHGAAVRLLLAMSPAASAPIARQLVASATAAGWPADAVSALARVAATHPEDPGVLVTVLLDHVLLAPGQALTVPAGVVHSYVYGLGVEVMTSSDNVLRLGLTSKPVAPDEALAAVRDDRRPEVVEAFAGEPLSSPDLPFSLAFAVRPHALEQGTPRVVLALVGEARVACGEESVVLPEGRALVLLPQDDDAVVDPAGTAIVVRGAQPPG
ncbi:MAG: type I phosphomannose isomerase catalytic subunit [bacterium]